MWVPDLQRTAWADEGLQRTAWADEGPMATAAADMQVRFHHPGSLIDSGTPIRVTGGDPPAICQRPETRRRGSSGSMTGSLGTPGTSSSLGGKRSAPAAADERRSDCTKWAVNKRRTSSAQALPVHAESGDASDLPLLALPAVDDGPTMSCRRSHQLWATAEGTAAPCGSHPAPAPPPAAYNLPVDHTIHIPSADRTAPPEDCGGDGLQYSEAELSPTSTAVCSPPTPAVPPQHLGLRGSLSPETASDCPATGCPATSGLPLADPSLQSPASEISAKTTLIILHQRQQLQQQQLADLMARSARLQAICAQQHKHLMTVVSTALASGPLVEADPLANGPLEESDLLQSGPLVEADPFPGDDFCLLGRGTRIFEQSESLWLCSQEAADAPDMMPWTL